MRTRQHETTEMLEQKKTNSLAKAYFMVYIGSKVENSVNPDETM